MTEHCAGESAIETTELWWCTESDLVFDTASPCVRRRSGVERLSLSHLQIGWQTVNGLKVGAFALVLPLDCRRRCLV